MTDMLRVQLGYQWTDPDGNEHAPDDVVEVDLLVGRQLLSDGKARLPDEDAPTAAAPERTTSSKPGKTT